MGIIISRERKYKTLVIFSTICPKIDKHFLKPTVSLNQVLCYCYDVGLCKNLVLKASVLAQFMAGHILCCNKGQVAQNR